MLLVRRICVCALLAPLVSAIQGWGVELSAGDVAEIVANRLEVSQVRDGSELGLWPDEEQFVGPTTAGMVCAYEWMQKASYCTSAIWGASYVVHAANIQGYLLGDEAYALVKMSELSESEMPWMRGIWAPVLAGFYSSLRNGPEGSTQQYLQYFDGLDPSTNVFYFAHHAVAAYYVNDPDKDVWRDALVAWLSRVDDQSNFPVMALGVATWALAETGTLDDTPVAADDSSPQWEGVKLSDLPSLLVSHQVPQEEPYGGSFYWRFDHTSGDSEDPTAGYTEDTIYGALGSVAAASLETDTPDGRMKQAIQWAQKALLQSVDSEGRVYEHLSQQGEARHVFAGEMLQALWNVKQYLDSPAGSESQM
jgi:hypothetical protein